MGESLDNSAGDGEKAGPEAAKTPGNEVAANAGGTSESKSSESHLPVVWSPKLDAHEATENECPQFDAEEAMSAQADQSADEEQAGAASGVESGRSSRFVLLAATIALAAGTGSFLGSLGASGVARLMAPVTGAARNVDASDATQATKLELAELTALKASLDSASRNTTTQFGKIADRLDRVEHAQTDRAAAIAHIADTVDRFDKRSTAAPEVTGSIASSPPQDAEPKIPDRILEGWTVQDVQNGRALVASRYGGVFDVGAGSVLPGVGRVDSVKRQDGQWIVVTARGTIVSGR
jgi:hypothetical protein